MNKYLIALPSFAGGKGFCYPTVLVSAKSKEEAISKAMRLRPGHNIGDIKQVYY